MAAMDTSTQKMTPESEKAEQPGMKEKEYRHDFKGALWGAPWMWGKMNEREQCEWNECMQRPMPMGMMFHPLRRLLLMHAMFVMVFLIVCLLMNILLTILVSLDMAHRHQFNGLWIPVLLLMGVPGTALYALFRIGDNIKAKEQ